VISEARDPFHNLPNELLIQVFGFLHPFEVWAKRVICRRWNDVLSSDVFTKAAIVSFATHDPEDSALDLRTCTNASPSLALRHITALRNGRPFSCVYFDDEFAFLPNRYPIAHQLRLKGKRIAYLRGDAETGQGNTVVVRDLVTGAMNTVCGDAREKVVSIELTSDIVALFTYTGTVCIAPLLDPNASRAQVRLPSASIVATGAHRGSVACLLKASTAFTAVIHDSKLRKSMSFNLENLHGGDEAVDCYAILVDAHKQVADFFSVTKQKLESTLCVRISRYSWAGECTTRTSLVIWHGLQDISYAFLASMQPAGERGLYQSIMRYEGLEFSTWPESDGSDGRNNRGVPQPRTSSPTLLFDAIAFTLKAVDCHPAVKFGGAPGNRPNTAVWKDRRYYADSRTSSEACIQAVRRGLPFDGPHTLRRMPNRARSTPKPVEEPSSSDDGEDVYVRYKARAIADPRPGSLRPLLTTHRQNISSTQIVLAHKRRESPTRRIHVEHGLRKKFHTVVAMNDTFALATSLDSGYIGVLCFDERVPMHGSEPAHSFRNKWVEYEASLYKYRRPWDVDC
jgi:hypothetical protein